MSASVCRSCGAPIVWAVTVTGHRMPVDADPGRGGTVTLRDRPGLSPIALVVGAAPPGAPLRHRPHFASCPHADDWRSRT
jgi:hypothetical protein